MFPRPSQWVSQKQGTRVPSMLTPEDEEWVGQWWSPGLPFGRGHDCWEPLTPEWPRTAGGLRCLWQTCSQSWLSENTIRSQMTTPARMGSQTKKERRGGRQIKQAGSAVKNNTVRRKRTTKEQEMHAVNNVHYSSQNIVTHLMTQQ